MFPKKRIYNKVIILIAFCVISVFVIPISFYFFKIFQSSKNHSLQQREINIYSHRGFNLQNKKKNWLVYPANQSSSIINSLKTYNGVEFDLHEVNSTNRKKEIVLLHNDHLDLYSFPKVHFSNYYYKESNPPKLNLNYTVRSLEESFQVQPIKIQRLIDKDENYSLGKLQTFVNLYKKLKNKKTTFWELKTGGKKAFRLYKTSLPFKVSKTILDNNLAKNSVVISFYWWVPIKSKIAALSKGKYLLTGIDVVDQYVTEQYVYFAKILGYDFFMPPHDQVNLKILQACKKVDLKLVSWSRGTIKDEDRSLKTLLNLYFSLSTNERPSLGLIVNQNEKHIKRLINRTKQLSTKRT
ncbi:MAG: hypothetical protein QNJ31_05545 [Candidatus Caenarcaniphilales bacterium]|nr:hypothetical protein [Candidatus Caenarcaniphilales bacterium]